MFLDAVVGGFEVGDLLRQRFEDLGSLHVIETAEIEVFGPIAQLFVDAVNGLDALLGLLAVLGFFDALFGVVEGDEEFGQEPLLLFEIAGAEGVDDRFLLFRGEGGVFVVGIDAEALHLRT